MQLAKHAGATVIGLASEPNHKWLASHGVVRVPYGDGARGPDPRRRPAGRMDAIGDTQGGGYVELALELGVAPERIDTIADFAPQKYGVKADGNAAGASAEVLAELAALIDSGRLEVPIAAVYPLANVQDAYRELEKGHTRGKIVLKP